MRQISIKRALLATAVLAVGTLGSAEWSPGDGLVLSVESAAGQGGSAVNSGERRRRRTTVDTACGGRRSGCRCGRCGHSLRPRACKWQICLPLKCNAAHTADQAHVRK